MKVLFLWTGSLPVEVLVQVLCSSDCNEDEDGIMLVVGQNDKLSQPSTMEVQLFFTTESSPFPCVVPLP